MMELNQGTFDAVQSVVASVAHDLKNPLNALNMNVMLLARKLGRAGAKDHYAAELTQIQGQIARIDQLLRDFADSAPRVELSLEETNLNEVLSEALAERSADAEGKGVSLEFSPAPHLSPFPFDRTRIRLVADELIQNALAAVPVGGVVEVESERAGPKGVFRVRDNGPGLPRDLSIFGAFATTDDESAGLGLTVARSIVRQHGGSIAVEEADEGACFRVELPLEPVVLRTVGE